MWGRAYNQGAPSASAFFFLVPFSSAPGSVPVDVITTFLFVQVTIKNRTPDTQIVNLILEAGSPFFIIHDQLEVNLTLKNYINKTIFTPSQLCPKSKEITSEYTDMAKSWTYAVNVLSYLIDL